MRETSWQVILAAIVAACTVLGLLGTLLVYDVTSRNNIVNLTSAVASFNADINQQLRDIKTRVDAATVFPVQIQDLARRMEANERRLDSHSDRLQSFDRDMAQLRSQADNDKSAFSNVFPRIEKLEGHQGRYQGIPPP